MICDLDRIKISNCKVWLGIVYAEGMTKTMGQDRWLIP